jgi:hypothetical protein
MHDIIFFYTNIIYNIIYNIIKKNYDIMYDIRLTHSLRYSDIVKNI